MEKPMKPMTNKEMMMPKKEMKQGRCGNGSAMGRKQREEMDKKLMTNNKQKEQ
jgi:hypothetical protein